MGVVVFDLVEFRSMFPTNTATEQQLDMFFYMAEGLLNNTKCSEVKDLKKRKYLLYLLVEHISTLQKNVENGSPVVGRASSASEGTVSITLDYGTMGNNERWYLQTPAGAMYWQFTKAYRSAIYRYGLEPMPVRREYVR